MKKYKNSVLKIANHIFFLGSILLYIFLRINYPITILSTLPHDDTWYLNKALSLKSGLWLGSFSQFTLMKGVGFPVFLGFVSMSGLSLNLAFALLHLCACLLILDSFRAMGIKKYLSFCIFCVVLYNPFLFPDRVIRDYFYTSILLCFIASLIYLIAPKKTKYPKVTTVSAGILLGIIFLTREEGIWVLPALISIFVIFLLINAKEKLNYICVKKIICGVLIISLSFSATLMSVATVNLIKYKTFTLCDYSSGTFQRCLTILQKVDVGPEIPYLQVGRQKREELYRISPSFCALRNYFEGSGLGWTTHGEAFYPWTKNDYAFGWFTWAFRDAVASVGGYCDSTHANQYYKRIIKEINDAAEKKQIKLKSRLFHPMFNISSDQLKLLPKKFYELTKLALHQMNVQTRKNTQPYATQKEYDYFLNRSCCNINIAEEKTIINGWYVNENDLEDWVSFSELSDAQKNKIDRMSSIDLNNAYKTNKYQNNRFSISVPKDSNIFIQNRSGIIFVFSEQQLKAGSFTANNENAKLHIDSVQRPKVSIIGDNVVKTLNSEVSIKIVNFLHKIYEKGTPILSAVAFGCFFIRICVRRLYLKKYSNFYLFMFSILILILTRITLLAFLDVSSFPAIFPYYIMPILPLVHILSVLLIFQPLSDERIKNF